MRGEAPWPRHDRGRPVSCVVGKPHLWRGWYGLPPTRSQPGLPSQGHQACEHRRPHGAGQPPRPGGSSLEEERRESAVGSPPTRRGQWEDASRQGPGWTVRNLGDPGPWQMLSSPHTVEESAPRPGRPNRAAPVPDSGPLARGSWPPCSEGGFPELSPDRPPASRPPGTCQLPGGGRSWARTAGEERGDPRGDSRGIGSTGDLGFFQALGDAAGGPGQSLGRSLGQVRGRGAAV